jgi:integrase
MISKNLAQDAGSVKVNPMSWEWPHAPQTFNLYDKYANVSVRLVLGERTWSPSVQGKDRKFNFAPGEIGLFQQKLVLLTQANFSPSSFYKFTYTLLRHWSLFLELLETEPDDIKFFWDRKVLTIDLAKTAKSILQLAALHSLGPWDTFHQKLIKKLSTRANSTVAAQRDKIAKRSKLLPPSSQADIVSLLDKKAGASDLLEWQIEGLAVLALGFQHAIRPVQCLSLWTSHVQLIDESEGSAACIISFHEAKKRNQTGNLEISRQVKPEWAPLILKLLDFASISGRTRLFATTDSVRLWKHTKKVCKQFDVTIDYNYYNLRHSGAQMLADAGHGRSDIKNFLGHSRLGTGATYIKSSKKQAGFLNKALGVSKLYSKIESIASGKYVSVEEVEAAHEDNQIAGVVGDRLIAGIGLCAKGQGNCVYDPVMSCYNCKKYMPVLNPLIHQEAIVGMRQQVLFFVKSGGNKESPSYLQLSAAIAGAQKALAISNAEVPQA